MSAFKGTPGPWQISTENQTIIKQDMSLIGLPNGGVLIGSACGHESSGFFPATDQAAANARLIAAAPELLALAERVARLNRDAGEIGAGMLASLIDEARAVIAKATGGDA